MIVHVALYIWKLNVSWLSSVTTPVNEVTMSNMILYYDTPWCCITWYMLLSTSLIDTAVVAAAVIDETICSVGTNWAVIYWHYSDRRVMVPVDFLSVGPFDWINSQYFRSRLYHYSHRHIQNIVVPFSVYSNEVLSK